ncbi:hypothetical protein BKI52_00275 [marine bacterium AO1-C]|nr:hypothetical protein BKI52_00275 [marine bacterium AO1-C]
MKTKVICILALFLISSFKPLLKNDLVEYQISRKKIKKGIVKMFERKNPTIGPNEIFYDEIVLRPDNQIFLTRYDNKFKIIRKDIYDITPESYSLKSIKYYVQGIKSNIKIVKPRIISLSSNNKIFDSKLIINLPSQQMIQIDTTHYKGKIIKKYKDKPLESIKFLVSSSLTVKYSKNEVNQLNTKEEVYFGKGIGWYLTKSIEKKPNNVTTTELVRMIPIKEFEKMKGR